MPMSAKAPKWIDTFLLGDEKSKEIIKVRSVSAIMLFTRNYEHETRIFAIPFGSGRNLISKGVIEERFGLVTALSAIDKDKLRSIEHKQFGVSIIEQSHANQCIVWNCEFLCGF